MTKAVEAALGFGGNIGDVVSAFAQALRRLGEAPGTRVLRISSVYRTAPWGKTDQPDFLNMAAIVETSLAPRALLAVALQIERDAGRKREERWGPRTLDIDVLTYGDAVIDEPDLQIPHPRIAERAFVLIPLAEIAPDLRIKDETAAMLATQMQGDDVARDEEATQRLKGRPSP